MQVSTKQFPQTFHMSLAEPLIVLIVSLFGISLSVGIFLAGVGDFIKTIMLLAISVYGLFVAFTMTRKLEIGESELIISYLLSKRIIAKEDINSYSLDEQGINHYTQTFVTIHLANDRRIKFKFVREGNDSLIQALESFTGLKPAKANF